MSERHRRLVFGEIAELYDASRPTYPAALVDDLVAWAAAEPAPRALEIGAGTGKATRLLAARGVEVLAIEPSPEMAAVARRTTAASGLVEVVESDFEHADLAGRRFPLVYAAQAWHWVEPAAGFRCAREALLAGGRLAAIWNRPVWDHGALRVALDAAYDRHAPDLEPGLARPADSLDSGRDWTAEVAQAGGFTDAETRRYDWSLRYEPREYVDLVATHSEVRLLDDRARTALLHAVGEAVAEHGGVLELAMHTRVCIARAA